MTAAEILDVSNEKKYWRSISQVRAYLEYVVLAKQDEEGMTWHLDPDEELHPGSDGNGKGSQHRPVTSIATSSGYFGGRLPQPFSSVSDFVEYHRQFLGHDIPFCLVEDMLAALPRDMAMCFVYGGFFPNNFLWLAIIDWATPSRLLTWRSLLDQASRLERIATHHNQILAELETEMAIAQEALKTMMQQRNDTHALLAPLSSTVDAGEALFDNVDEQMVDVECDLYSLQGGSEKQISSASITDHSETLYEIKPEIEEGQLELRRPLKQRKDVSEQLDLHRDLLSPIRKVPPEIISSDSHFLQSPTHVSSSVLTGVCVAWKNIALGMPELWSFILVEIRKGKFYPDKRTIGRWIERSGSSALAFSIEERDSSFHSSHAGVDQIPPTMPHDNTNSEHPAGSPVASMLDPFSPHYSRWQRVRLRYSDASPGTVVTALPLPINTTYPLLEEVYLDKGYWWAQEDLDCIKSMMVSAPRLHSVTWLSEKSYKMLAFPWKQLTHFLQGPIATMNEGLRVLAICPHLKSLELTLFLPMFPIDDDDDPFVHNTLERLHLRTAGNLAVLFDKVTLPALKDLSLSELHGASPNPPIQLGRWPQSQFLAFLLRSGCTIKQFIIQEWDISAEEIAECLVHPQISKSLDSLSITEYHQKHLCMTDGVLRLLTYSPSVILSENVLGGGDDQLIEDAPSETIRPNLTTIKLWDAFPPMMERSQIW
ncbi:uncharacterized protein LACBIDRAFT_329467 [Laccaria bicolor S238N-H82]|uniref:Predicted protein n=1 Tax=Laccaria bicolor (strain S238N-H82 / ATCC MYA-4686) TaxID=486041 RepID=B0DI42_LACBS|nr:uncharacterized protein LACBIDRAFT_329467 [Laccaria bicolor S238N-H82]EDR05938.1 predicted protein [Laccaria bicolor S238N-H82]|eukprot:XP_001883614.1 predicted protein [Laccaria bicolor S238N-H82]